jgi:hydroxymethylpyrimidine/phosphomethylpyrimidine kinase
MQRNYVLSIAGYDPCGGAGLLADIKTFEQTNTYGMGVCTGLTVQHESQFDQVEWTTDQLVFDQLNLLLQKYSFSTCKIGLVRDWQQLHQLCEQLKHKQPSIKIIVDPILRASAGFTFHDDTEARSLSALLKNIDLLTPNAIELGLLCPDAPELHDAAQQLAKHCSILFKGGHNTIQVGTDILYTNERHFELQPQKRNLPAKHGSGCVLSAAIAAYWSQEADLKEACILAKKYISNYLGSSTELLGFHHQ